MAKFVCVCGEQITTSGEIPNRNEWKLVSDVEYEKFTGRIDAEELYLAMTIMFKCPRSGHLYVWWDGFDKAATVYEPLDEQLLPET